MFRRPMLMIAAFAALFASVAQARPMATAEPSRAEAIYGARFDERGLTLRVNSNGCTRKEDFAMRVDRAGSVTRVLAVRIKPDYCRALIRGGVDLTWSHAELGVRRGVDVRVMNRFAVW